MWPSLGSSSARDAGGRVAKCVSGAGGVPLPARETVSGLVLVICVRWVLRLICGDEHGLRAVCRARRPSRPHSD